MLGGGPKWPILGDFFTCRRLKTARLKIIEQIHLLSTTNKNQSQVFYEL